MSMLEQLCSVAYAGMAAGAIGDLIAESTVMERAREKIKNFWELEDGDFIDCRYCVSAWACLFTVPIVTFQDAYPLGVGLLALPVAWKISTALRGWYG